MELDIEHARDNYNGKQPRCSMTSRIPRGHSGSKAKKPLNERLDCVEESIFGRAIEKSGYTNSSSLHGEIGSLIKRVFRWGCEALQACQMY